MPLHADMHPNAYRGDSLCEKRDGSATDGQLLEAKVVDDLRGNHLELAAKADAAEVLARVRALATHVPQNIHVNVNCRRVQIQTTTTEGKYISCRACMHAGLTSACRQCLPRSPST